jgi:Carbohydrate family 9 binding domain-like
MEAFTSYLSTYVTVASFLSEDFAPDADLTKPVWGTSARVRLRYSQQADDRTPELNTEVAALWSESNLYFGFWCQFTELFVYEGESPTEERWELWDRDVVEVFINPFPERVHTYWEFEVAPTNQWVDLAINLDKEPSHNATWNSHFEHATRVDPEAKSWFCEMRIPVSSLGVDSIRAGMEWRINFYRCDGRGDETRRRFLAWSPTFDKSFHVPSRFGLIHFKR